MIELRSQNARQPGHGDHEKRVGLHPPPVEIRLQNIGGRNQRQGNHQSKCGYCQRSQMKVRNHSSVLVRLPKSIHEATLHAVRGPKWNSNPSASHTPRAIHSVNVKCPGTPGIHFISTSNKDTAAPRAATKRSHAPRPAIYKDTHAASHPNAEAMDPTSVTGTSSASPTSNPTRVATVTPAIATLGVRCLSLILANIGGIVRRRPNANSNREAATKLPLNTCSSPTSEIPRINRANHVECVPCSKAIAVAKRLPTRPCHGAM